MNWEEMMWAEIGALTTVEQIAYAGELIERLDHDLVPRVADLRRDKILEVLADPEWDATRLAETVGARRTTIARLAGEGRAKKREQELRAHANAGI